MEGFFKGLKHPNTISQDITSILKPEVDWTNVEDVETLGKIQGLNTISMV